jgi:tetratricopeptide (TPR) repeat protein/class 3 adenylate cyclase
LLTALESKRVRRLGAVSEQRVDVKLIAATQADLNARLAAGQFRHDLYHRLAVVVLDVPPLRERGEDILLLAQHFLRRYGESHGLVPKRLSGAAEAWLRGYGWPGNVRELSHLMERVTLLSPEAVLTSDTLERLCLPRPQPSVPVAAAAGRDAPASLDEPGRIALTLRETGGNVARAARLLGLSRSALRRRLHRYGMARPGPSAFPEAQGARHVPSPSPPTPTFPHEGGRGAQGHREGEEAAGTPDAWSSADAPAASPGPAPVGERRPVAVLAISLFFPATVDPSATGYEPWTLTARWQQTIAEKVQGFGGTFLQRTPSPLIAVFGLPKMLDQMPQRAVQAALAIRQLVAQTEAPAGRRPLPEVRLAVHLGEVLVDVRSNFPTGPLLAVGDTLSLPVHLLGHAAPGEILLSPQVAHLVEGSFATQARQVPLAGEQSDPRIVYGVVGLDRRRFPLTRFGARVHSRFVGRERELAVLRDLLAQVAHGGGQVVGLVGEPGVGKSRLCYEFTHLPLTQGWRLLESAALSYGKTTAYLPVIDLLKAYFQIDDRDEAGQVCKKVTGKLLTLDAALQPTISPLLALLDVAVEDPQWQALNPLQRRQRTLDAVKRLLIRESQAQPLLLILEDLHWIDGETQALLDALIDSLPSARILLVLSYRPEHQHHWGNKSCYTQIRLDPLPPESAVELLAALVGDDVGLESLKRGVLERTEGNPFFLEESVHALVDTGVLVGERGAYRLATYVGAAPRGRPRVGNHRGLPLPIDIQVPATVQAVLAARIDRLPLAERHLLQEASVIGKDIPFSVLQAIAERSEGDLRRCLAHLQAAEFLYETGLFPELTYTFKHALTHEVAYGSLGQERRRVLHARAVQAIEALYADHLTDHVEQLAHHALHGQVWGKAFAYCRQAGAKAYTRAAHRQALTYLEQALNALQHLPERRDTLEQAIDLRLDLRYALVPLGEIEPMLDHLRAAATLAEALHDQRRLGEVSSHMTHYFWAICDYDQAIEAGQRALGIAASLGDRSLQAVAYFDLGAVHRALGDYRLAMDYLQSNVASLEGYMLGQRLGMGGPLSVGSLSYLIWCLADLGEFAEGITRGEEAVRMAKALGQPEGLIFAYRGVGYLDLMRGDLHQAIPLLERSLRLCQDFPGYFPWIASSLGYAYALSGRLAEAMPLLERALQPPAAGKVGHAVRVAYLSEAYLLAGRMDKAVEFARHALEFARAHKERGNQAYALRLLGAIAAQQDPPESEEADAYHRQALALAEELGMRPLQAHCRRSFGTLYAAMGRHAEARAELDTAIQLYSAMEMAFWLPQAEAALSHVG